MSDKCDNYLTKVFKVYQISPEYRKHGVLLRTYQTIGAAERFMNKSIFRYLKEDTEFIIKFRL